MKSIVASIRLVIVTLLICVAGYTTAILIIARIAAPDSAQGSLIKDEQGREIGSRLIAQKFTRPEYFWPRPSAVDYNASATGASNKSPTSSDLTERAKRTVAEYGATAARPLPAELAAASGGGLDPHITEHAALYQVARVAQAREISEREVIGLIDQQAFSLGRFLIEDRLVNVLELNLALDALRGKRAAR